MASMVSAGRTAVMLVALALPLAHAHACDIPVFQYALDWWEPDAYEVHVFHDGRLAPDQQSALRLLQEAGDQGGPQPANLNLTVVGPAAPGEPAAAPPPDFPVPKESPGMAVRFPKHTGIAAPLWSGPLTTTAVKALLDSPMRQEIARLLRVGKAAVWVLVESGSPAADDSAFSLLESELRRLEQVLTLPAPDPDAEAAEDNPPARKASFALLRLARDLPAESLLVKMLLGSEPELAKLGRQPAVFPVFGRGLILYALAGRGINQRNLVRTAEFLAGPCSCLVKAENPGIDLLMKTSWATGAPPVLPTPPVAGLAGFEDRAAAARRLLATPPGADPAGTVPNAQPADDDAARFLLVAAAGAALLAMLGAVLLAVAARALLQLRRREQETEP